MRASTAVITSSGETCRARYRRARRVAGMKQRSRSATGSSWSFRGAAPAGLAPARLQHLARVQRVAEPVADVVDAEHGEEDGGAGEDGPVRSEVQVVLGVVEDAPPRRNVGRES